MQRRWRATTAVLAGLMLVTAACGGDDDTAEEPEEEIEVPEEEPEEEPAEEPEEEPEEPEEEPEESQGGDIEEPVTIGWTPSALSPTDFFGLFQQGMEEELQALDIEYELFSRAAPRQDAHDAQFNIIEDLISLEPDVMIVSPTSFEQQFGAYELINDAGIPLFMANQNRPEDYEELPFEILQYSGYSHLEGAEALAEHLRETIDPETAQVAILRGVPGDTVDVDRSQPVKDMLEDVGATLVTEEVANYQRDEAFQKTLDIMAAYPEINIIYGISSDMAAGAMAALETLNIVPGEDVDVYGYGGTPEELENILEGRQTGSVFRDPMEMGAATAQAIQKLLEGNGDQIENYFEATMSLIATCEDIVEVVPPMTFGSEEAAPTMEDC